MFSRKALSKWEPLRGIALVLTMAALATSSAAAEDSVDVQHWHNLFVQGRMTAPSSSSSDAPASPAKSPALFYLELQPRLSFGEGRPDVALLRGALGYELAPGLSLWAGAAAIPRFDAPDWRVNETRVFQQLMLVDKLGPVALMLRARLEQRTFENAPELALRARAMLRAVYTLPIGNGDWGVVAFDEPFVGLLGPAQRVGFDQNRAFVGVLHKLTPWASVEGGYLWVYLRQPGLDGDSSRHLHALLVQTIFNLI
jgi:hypothetical protein